MAEEIIKQMRDFPAVEELLQEKTLTKMIAAIPRPVAAEIVKTIVARLKSDFKAGESRLTRRMLVNQIAKALAVHKRSEISRVINATGIVVHTNLGRAPLSEKLFEAVKETVTGYGNVEFDLSTGARGHRGVACEKYLAVLSGAESATVVNNCAAALFLILNTLANHKDVVISRGELIQIGGGFRIPDILKKSGARLCEVGTTNITTAADYDTAITDKTGIILKVHQSNFVQSGFTEGVSLRDLVGIAGQKGLPVVNDLGSGVFIPTMDVLGYAEPTVQQSVRDGATVTCFSGDKMVGGCQAGLIVGQAEVIQKIRRNPLFRMMRVDKIVFAMLEKVLGYYLDNGWQDEIKVWSLLGVAESDLYRRGKKILKNLGNPAGVAVEATRAFVGGGALPEAHIPSVGITFSSDFKARTLLDKFRFMTPPIIGRIDADRCILDLKAIDEADLSYLEQAIKQAITKN